MSSLSGIPRQFCLFNLLHLFVSKDSSSAASSSSTSHDDVIKWKHFPRYWPFVWGIHRSPVNSPHKGQWRGALMFSLICALNKRLSKQSWGWWFETPTRSLWRHCNAKRNFELVNPGSMGYQWKRYHFDKEPITRNSLDWYKLCHNQNEVILLQHSTICTWFRRDLLFSC